MGRITISSRRVRAARPVLVMLAAATAAGCSNDATRLADGPLFAGSTANQREILSGTPAPLTPVESRSFAPAATEASTASTGARGVWSTVNAPIVTVGQGETLAILSQRHGVPADVILRANAIADASAVQPGMQLLIPTYVYRDGEAMLANTAGAPGSATAGDGSSAAAARGPRPLGQLTISADEASRTADAVPASATASAGAGAGGTHLVQPGETLWSIARANGVSPKALMDANDLPADYRVKAGERLAIPGGSGATAGTAVAEADPSGAAGASGERRAAGAESGAGAGEAGREVQVASVANEAVRAGPVMSDAVEDTGPEAAPRDDEATAGDGGVSGFRWPARGRIVAGFGKQANGERNDGINLALPAGTPIRAAQGGKVIYAGDELKGYGNLILLQHEGGWVTAYAHAQEMMVSRGDRVRRGEVIATVGSTGNVSQPQLHFEIRQGSKPVDPLPHLSGA